MKTNSLLLLSTLCGLALNFSSTLFAAAAVNESDDGKLPDGHTVKSTLKAQGTCRLNL